MTNLIEFTQEQSMLLETAMDFCSKQSPLSEVREKIESATELDENLWSQMVELGWMGITIPENYGGLGLGLGEVVPIVESMGRNLMVSPFVTSTLATQALIEGGSEEQKAEWLPKIASGAIASMALAEADGSWDLTSIACRGTVKSGQLELTGSKFFVLDAAVADLLIVSVEIKGGPALVLLERSQLTPNALSREVVIDETRRSYQLNLDGICVDVTQVLSAPCLKSMENSALLLCCAEMAGGIAGVLDVIVEYLKTRKQFDHYIGSYQALKHPTVDILVGLEGCRSHLYHTATIISGEDEREIEIALRMAKAQASEAFAFAGDRAIQFHGGFGFTYECDAQLYLRRALWCQYQYGDERHHRLLLAPLLLN